MNFEEHLTNHRNTDGTYDLDAAEEDRRHEIETTPQELVKLARKAAKQERTSWLSAETASLRRQFQQPALSPSLELDVMVPLGNGSVVRLGEMNHDRIVLRRDMRRRVHEDAAAAYAVEITHWEKTEQLLQRGETVEGAILRGRAVAA